MDAEVQVAEYLNEPVPVLALSGPLYLRSIPALLTALAKALAEHAVLVCDLTGLAMLGRESQLAVFPAALRRAGGWPVASLHLVAPQPELRGRLARQRMERYLPVHGDLFAALAAAELDLDVRRLERTLPAEIGSPREARAMLAEFWPGPRHGVADDAQVVLSELVTNAVLHTGRPCTVCLSLSARRTLLAVTDNGRGQPVLHEPGPITGFGAGHGLGLRLVEVVSRDWGVRLVHPAGKTVWASLPPPQLVPRSRSALPR